MITQEHVLDKSVHTHGLTGAITTDPASRLTTQTMVWCSHQMCESFLNAGYNQFALLSIMSLHDQSSKHPRSIKPRESSQMLYKSLSRTASGNHALANSADQLAAIATLEHQIKGSTHGRLSHQPMN